MGRPSGVLSRDVRNYFVVTGWEATQLKMALAAAVGCRFVSASEKPSLNVVPATGERWYKKM